MDTQNKKTLVFGTSLKPQRYSNMAVQKLVNYDYEVYAFGPRQGTVAMVEVDTTLKAYPDVDTITLYLNPTNQKMYYDYLIGLKPRRIIFNPGTENPELFNLLKAEGIEAEVACTLVLLATDQY